jgi:hypothetical protein
VNDIGLRALKLGLIVTAGIGAAALLSSGMRGLLVEVYLLTIGAVLLLALVRTTRAQVRSDRPSAYDTTAGRLHVWPPDTGTPALTDELELSMASEFHLHIRLCPLLREIASFRLRAHYGVDLTAEPRRARDLVGEPVWELIDPRRPKPKDRLARGPSLACLREVIATLESL